MAEDLADARPVVLAVGPARPPAPARPRTRALRAVLLLAVVTAAVAGGVAVVGSVLDRDGRGPTAVLWSVKDVPGQGSAAPTAPPACGR